MGELKVTRLATLFDRQLQAFPDLPQCSFWAFLINYCPLKMYTYVALNVEGDFFFDFPTPWALLHLFYNGGGHP